MGIRSSNINAEQVRGNWVKKVEIIEETLKIYQNKNPDFPFLTKNPDLI